MQNQNRDYISYLNSLHSVSADNKNAYAETNVTSPFFSKTIVTRKVGEYIEASLNKNGAFMLILTGHAGDGKTSLLVQTLRSWRVLQPGDALKSEDRFQMPNGRYCTYVKDFSEDVSEVQRKKLRRYMNLVKSGECVFLVANTGPLIAAFGDVLSRERQTQLVNAIDRNDAAVECYDDVRVAVLNAATIDNSTFVRPFLNRILSPELWTPCADCEKNFSCPVYANAKLLRKALERAAAFIQNHYTWQQEHDRKVTIRQIVAHLTYSITGGKNCVNVRRMPTALGSNQYKFVNLFSNMFFGYRGFRRDRYGGKLTAISEIAANEYDRHRFKMDEKLFIREDFQSFLPDVRTILKDIPGWEIIPTAAWQAAIRRAYIFFDTNPDQDAREQLLRDIFSNQFPRYLQIRRGEDVSSSDKKLIISALQMIFTGSRESNDRVKITLMRSNGITQGVQMVLNELKAGDFTVSSEDVNDFDDSCTHKRLVLSLKGSPLHVEITLPMLDYFDDISHGAIATNIDPLLSHGIDSLKAQLISSSNPEEKTLTLSAMSESGWKELQAEYKPDTAIWNII